MPHAPLAAGGCACSQMLTLSISEQRPPGIWKDLSGIFSSLGISLPVLVSERQQNCTARRCNSQFVVNMALQRDTISARTAGAGAACPTHSAAGWVKGKSPFGCYIYCSSIFYSWHLGWSAALLCCLSLSNFLCRGVQPFYDSSSPSSGYTKLLLYASWKKSQQPF